MLYDKLKTKFSRRRGNACLQMSSAGRRPRKEHRVESLAPGNNPAKNERSKTMINYGKSIVPW